MRHLVVILLLGMTAALASAQTVQHGLRVPDGFEVTEFADNRLANDVYNLTLDGRGRVLVSGRGYLKVLVDDDADGRADRATDFAQGPRDGAMGLLWEGASLFVTGDGGLRRFRDADGDGRADGPSELIRSLKTGGEHSAHAIRRGPDGWLYVLCGNNTGIDGSYATLRTSPIRRPVAGCVLRFTPDLNHSEIVADGLRNAYGMDFNADGELFTYDSDNERCVALPWYEPTRLYHIIPGGHYGWRNPQLGQFWRLPPYACDVVAPLTTLGRGSPTGVACYRHVQFPTAYHGGLFVLDWTFGRIWFLKLKRAGASYACENQVFLQAVGDNGFAPTGIVVHPETGDVYVAIGGRGTRGAVYRIRYPQRAAGVDATAVARLQPRPRSLEWEAGRRGEWLRHATAGTPVERLDALALVRRHRGQLTVDELLSAVRANWDHSDRLVRQATADLIAALDERERSQLTAEARQVWAAATLALAKVTTGAADVLDRSSHWLADPKAPPEALLTWVRLVQLALGDLTAPKEAGRIWEGYTPRRPLPASGYPQLSAALRRAFPTGHADLDRELTRTLAMLADADADIQHKVVARLTAGSNPIDDVHYLAVLARLTAPRSGVVTHWQAEALLHLDRKLTERRLTRDTFWPLRVTELVQELARRDGRLLAALAEHEDFGRPEHALFAQLDGFDRRRAAAAFVRRAASDKSYAWNAAQIEVLRALPAEQTLPLLRRLWERGGLEEATLPLLAEQAQAIDFDKFLDGLRSPQVATVQHCLKALAKLPPPAARDALLLGLVRALRTLPDGKEGEPVRAELVAFLKRLTGQERLGNDREAWVQWLTRQQPDLAAKLGAADGVDVAAWQQRLGRLDWGAGDAGRGQAVFARASCAACHSGAQALGPDLLGVTGRFSRDDLLTAILRPSRDVSARYRTTLIGTADGKSHQGVIIYEATDGVILQTGAATTVRIAGAQIESRRTSPTSLMPTGLLDKCSDRDIADLYAYLKTLGAAARNSP